MTPPYRPKQGIPKFGKFLLVESGIMRKNSESHQRLKSRLPSSNVNDWNPVLGMRNPQLGIHDPRLSCFPLHGMTLKTLYKPRIFSGSLQ